METSSAALGSLILQHLDKNGSISDSIEFASKVVNKPHTEVDAALKSLAAQEYVNLTVKEQRLVELTTEALGYVQNGTPEFQYASAL